MKQEGKDFNLTGFQYGLAGALTGTLTRFLVQPLDVLKITLQLQVIPKGEQETAKFNSVFLTLRTVFREEGIRGLWKGHIPAQFLSMIYGGVQFSTYETLTTYFYETNAIDFSKTEHLVNIGCGAFAGLTATVASFPFDVVKTHLVYQSEPKIYKGTFDAIHKIYRRDGPRGFTKGLLAACIQTTPMSGLMFCFHGLFAQLWLLFFNHLNQQTEFLSTTGSVITGLSAGLCAKTIVYPYDLMKKRLQVQGLVGKHYTDKKILKCKNIRECFVNTVKTEGFLGLFKGFTPTLIKSGATTSLYFTIYSKVCHFIKYTTENI